MGEFNQVLEYEFLYDFGFLSSYLLSCMMGFLLMYSTMLCTSYNSALTTTIVGCLKVFFYLKFESFVYKDRLRINY